MQHCDKPMIISLMYFLSFFVVFGIDMRHTPDVVRFRHWSCLSCVSPVVLHFSISKRTKNKIPMRIIIFIYLSYSNKNNNSHWDFVFFFAFLRCNVSLSNWPYLVILRALIALFIGLVYSYWVKKVTCQRIFKSIERSIYGNTSKFIGFVFHKCHMKQSWIGKL